MGTQPPGSGLRGYVELYVGYDVPVQIVLTYLLQPLHSIHRRSVCRPSLPVKGRRRRNYEIKRALSCFRREGQIGQMDGRWIE
eukprot:scaffold90468_cov31-Attheya_sp.AAC.1